MEIKDRIEFENLYIILCLENNKVFPNNVIAMDYNGNEIWKINDIVKVIEPCGNTVIKKLDENKLRVISSVGMMYEIDVAGKKILKSILIR